MMLGEGSLDPQALLPSTWVTSFMSFGGTIAEHICKYIGYVSYD